MIPKIIHYCWLSNDEYPGLINNCISTWKEKLPDYEFVLWDTNRFNLDDSLWVKQAFNQKKYAFAADYIRLYAVYNFGGIYLDTDVEVLKNFDDLLHLPYFIGSEGNGNIEAGVFGANKKCNWIKDCLDYYENREFIKFDDTLDTLTLPRILAARISTNRKITEVSPNRIENLNDLYTNDKLIMFPQDYFCAKDHGTGVITKTSNTYSIHHFAMSWIPKKYTFLPKLKRKLINLFGEKPILFLIKTLKLSVIKNKLLKK